MSCTELASVREKGTFGSFGEEHVEQSVVEAKFASLVLATEDARQAEIVTNSRHFVTNGSHVVHTFVGLKSTQILCGVIKNRLIILWLARIMNLDAYILFKSSPGNQLGFSVKPYFRSSFAMSMTVSLSGLHPAVPILMSAQLPYSP